MLNNRLLLNSRQISLWCPPWKVVAVNCELVDSLSKYVFCASFPEYYAVQHLLFFVRETRSSWIGRFLHSRPCDWPLSTGAGWAPRFETSIVPRCKRGTFLTGTIPNGYFNEKGPLLHTPSDMTMHISFNKESFSCIDKVNSS